MGCGYPGYPREYNTGRFPLLFLLRKYTRLRVRPVHPMLEYVLLTLSLLFACNPLTLGYVFQEGSRGQEKEEKEEKDKGCTYRRN